MKRVVTDTVSKISVHAATTAIHYCRQYPVYIGRRVEACIGVHILQSAV